LRNLQTVQSGYFCVVIAADNLCKTLVLQSFVLFLWHMTTLVLRVVICSLLARQLVSNTNFFVCGGGFLVVVSIA